MFVSLPTGYGKSLCFVLLPRIFDSIRKVVNKSLDLVLVVSPLISLMQDQVASYSALGITAAAWDQDKGNRNKIKNGEVQLMFTSPEALFTSSQWLNILSSDVFQNHLVGSLYKEMVSKLNFMHGCLLLK